MNAKTLIAAAVVMSALGAASAFAQSDAGLTRAQVKAQTVEALRTGELQRWQSEADIDVGPVTHSNVTRAAVRAETARAAAAGEIAHNEYDYDVVPQPAAPSTVTRAEVKAELVRAMANGELPAITDSDAYPAYATNQYVSPKQREKLLQLSERLAVGGNGAKVN